MLSKQTDEALFLNFRDRGNPDALSILYSRYDGRLVRFVMNKKGLSRVEAEDVVHDAWHRALTKGEQFRARGPFRCWFISIVINCASSYLRQRFRRKRMLQLRGHYRAVNTLDAFIDRDWFCCSLNRLPLGQRKCLTLTYVDGLSMRQVAGQLKMAPSTVSRHISRAIESLQARLM